MFLFRAGIIGGDTAFNNYSCDSHYEVQFSTVFNASLFYCCCLSAAPDLEVGLKASASSLPSLLTHEQVHFSSTEHLDSAASTPYPSSPTLNSAKVFHHKYCPVFVFKHDQS